MTRTLEFYYNFVSPYSYLANTQIRSIAADLTDDAVLAGLLDGAGLDGRAIAPRLDDPGLAAELDTSTTAAAERGVFGGPTFFAGEQMFFGSDRLDWVEAALQLAAA
ncbi:MAG TPA: DsbA family protein [Caulobacteraceae bacterium]|jgi:2-hydroxychromene-2-carboxylate isomerase|nr:DsbA family protein [Caulobacteraceae bacterium]